MNYELYNLFIAINIQKVSLFVLLEFTISLIIWMGVFIKKIV